MLNRRQFSRYVLLQPLTGYIEHAEIRHRGEILELSAAGFRFRLRNSAKENFTALKGGLDYGEIVFQGREIGGFGEIRHVRAEGGDVLVGFRWDEIHAETGFPKIAGIIAELVARKAAGCVNIKEGVVELGGHVSSALADDVWQSISPDTPRVSLRECTSIDVGGLSLLISLEAAKVQIREASREVGALLQRCRAEGPESVFPALTPRPGGNGPEVRHYL